MSASSFDPSEYPDLVDKFHAFYRRHAQQALAGLCESYPHDTSSITIDWGALSQYSPGLGDDVLDDPEKIRELAEHSVATYDFPVPMDLDPGDVSVRFANVPESNQHDVGRYSPTDVAETLRGIRGQVSQMTQPDSLMTEAGFECQRCGVITRVPQSPNDWQEPHQCQGCEREGPFKINFQKSTMVDHQVVRLQTPPEEMTDQGTESLDLQLRGDVVGSVKPGERVVATAEMHLRQTETGKLKQPTFEPYGNAEAFEHLERDLEDVEVEKHREEFEEIANGEDPLAEIVASIAPSIHGYEYIKEAIAYQLFGGTRKVLPDGSSRRGSSHVLLVGDPGLGKTQLIKYACELSPRSVYTSGEGTTKAGLTAAAVNDDFGDGGWTIQAGALVQANGGIAGIDELDKMSDDDRKGLYEAMESQQVSKTAAGQSVTLPARTTLLAGANPTQGRFNKHQPLGEQVDLPAPLFSRFDLIFPMTDDRDVERDTDIANAMLSSARVGQKLEAGEEPDEGDTVTPTIEKETLRAYIAYARQEIVPELSDDAMDVIKQRYNKIRGANDDDGPVPTTPRTIDAMIRLSEAKARTRLSVTVTADDAKRACDLVEYALHQVGVDPESGDLDVDMVESGTSESQRQRVRGTTAIIKDLEGRQPAEIDEVRQLYEDRGFDMAKFEHTISKLKEQGDIYEPQSNTLRTT